MRSPLEAAAKTITGLLRATIRMCSSAVAAGGGGGGKGGGEDLKIRDETLQACMGKRKESTCTSAFLVKNVNKSRSRKEEEAERKSDGDDVSVQADNFVCFAAFQILWAPSPVSRLAFITLCSSAPLPLLSFCARFVWQTPSAPHDNFFSFPSLTRVSSGFFCYVSFFVFCFGLFLRDEREK